MVLSMAGVGVRLRTVLRMADLFESTYGIALGWRVPMGLPCFFEPCSVHTRHNIVDAEMGFFTQSG